MLLLPDKRIRKYQLTLIVVLAFTLPTMLLLVFWVPPIVRDYGKMTTLNGNIEYEEATLSFIPDVVYNLFPLAFGVLIFLAGLFILSESLFFWVPSLTDLSVDKNKGEMIWLWKRFRFPERIFSLLDADTRIFICRKRSSLKGLLMKEFTIEIYLPIDRPDIKQISDFTGIEKITKTSTHNILIKTVNLKNLPLQIIQVRTFLASSVISRLKANLSQKKPV